MTAGTRVAASLWSTPPDRIRAEADRLTEAGLQIMHWDHTDGHYTRAGGFTAAEAAAVTARTGLAAEAHLMVRYPVEEVDAWTEFCELVVVHADSQGWAAAVDRIQRRGSRAAVAITDPVQLAQVDGDTDVLVMSIPPGHAGTTFRRQALRTVRDAAASSPTRAVGLDGGVTSAVAPDALDAGATWLVSGGDLVSSHDPRHWLRTAGALPPGAGYGPRSQD